jgi:hypothetical protein
MEREQLLERERTMLYNLSKIPTFMLGIREREDVSAFLLHDLCSNRCFNLHKAAYFVDNPDFHCLRGITGFTEDEAYPAQTSVWHEPDDFARHLDHSSFNKIVRAVNHHSVKKQDPALTDGLQTLAHDLDFSQYGVCSWRMPHDNFGIVLYEKNEEQDHLVDQYLHDGLSLLGFCPLF